MTETHAPVLVRMPIEQKNRLVSEAKKHSRTLTGEINERLRVSLAAHGPTLQAILSRELTPGIAPVPASYSLDRPSNGTPIKQESPDYPLTGIDQAMLTVFRALPPEKQLALLSLFR